MLVLTRKTGEGILIGDDVKITIVEVRGNSIRLGIQAPRQKKIHRLEVYERIMNENREALKWHPSDLSKLQESLPLLNRRAKL